MNPNEVELFLHGAKGRPVAIKAEKNEVLRDVLAKHDALPADGEFVYIGESKTAQVDPDSERDDHAPADLDQTLEALDAMNKRFVRTKAVHSIDVSVQWNADNPSRNFSPSATVETVLVWAKHRLQIDPVAGAELVLELVSTTEVPRMNEQLGDLLKPGETALAFKLVKEVNPQG